MARFTRRNGDKITKTHNYIILPAFFQLKCLANMNLLGGKALRVHCPKNLT